MSYHQRPNTPNYYAILGVAPTASAEEVKRAFRNRALLHHPDRCSSRGGARPGSTGPLQQRLSLSGAGLPTLAGSEGAVDGASVGSSATLVGAASQTLMQDLEEKIATQNFQLIGEAYAVLSDETSRQQYDAELGFAGVRRSSFDGSGGGGNSSGEGEEDQLGASTFKHQDLDSFFAHLESKSGSGTNTGTVRRTSVIGTGFNGARPASKLSSGAGRPPTHPGASSSKTPIQQPLFPLRADAPPPPLSGGAGPTTTGFPSRPSSTQRVPSDHFTTFEFPVTEEAPIRASGIRPDGLFTPPVQKNPSSHQPSPQNRAGGSGSANANRSTLPSMKFESTASASAHRSTHGLDSGATPFLPTYQGTFRPPTTTTTALDSLAQTLHGGDLASFLTEDNDWEDRERNRWLDDARSRWDRRFVVSRNGEVSRRREPFFSKRSTTATPSSMTANGNGSDSNIHTSATIRLTRSDLRNTSATRSNFSPGERQQFASVPTSAMRRQLGHRTVLVTPGKNRANTTVAETRDEHFDRAKNLPRGNLAGSHEPTTQPTTAGSAQTTSDGKKGGRVKSSAAQRIEEARRRTWELFLQPTQQSYTVK